MLEEFLNHRLFIVIPRDKIDRLSELDDKIGHLRFLSGATMPEYVTLLLRNNIEIAIISNGNGYVLYSMNEFRTKNYVSIDEFLGNPITIDEEDFDLIFEKEKI